MRQVTGALYGWIAGILRTGRKSPGCRYYSVVNGFHVVIRHARAAGIVIRNGGTHRLITQQILRRAKVHYLSPMGWRCDPVHQIAPAGMDTVARIRRIRSCVATRTATGSRDGHAFGTRVFGQRTGSDDAPVRGVIAVPPDYATVWTDSQASRTLAPNATLDIEAEANAPISLLVTPEEGIDFSLDVGAVTFALLPRTSATRVTIRATAGAAGVTFSDLQLRGVTLSQDFAEITEAADANADRAFVSCLCGNTWIRRPLRTSWTTGPRTSTAIIRPSNGT